MDLTKAILVEEKDVKQIADIAHSFTSTDSPIVWQDVMESVWAPNRTIYTNYTSSVQNSAGVELPVPFDDISFIVHRGGNSTSSTYDRMFFWCRGMGTFYKSNSGTQITLPCVMAGPPYNTSTSSSWGYGGVTFPTIGGSGGRKQYSTSYSTPFWFFLINTTTQVLQLGYSETSIDSFNTTLYGSYLANSSDITIWGVRDHDLLLQE